LLAELSRLAEQEAAEERGKDAGEEGGQIFVLQKGEG